MNRFQTLLRELARPDNFRQNAYGELTNQMGHALAGVIATATTFFVWAGLTGELPYRAPVLVVLILLYIGFEMAMGWKPGDSWFDTAMWSFGVAAVVVPFEEITPGWPVVQIELHMGYWLGIVAAWAVALLIRVLRRVPDAE